MRRSHRLLQDYLDPDTIFFLGDLFDGGREWATAKTTSPDPQFRKYGNNFWLAEYRRFVSLFMGGWRLGYSGYPSDSRGRKIVSSLPGNHDLGFAGGIQLAVKQRFDAYFGPLNRVDVVGNHTFISLDTVSLSAMDQVDPATGSSGLGDGTAATASSDIWKPVNDFLISAEDLRRNAVHQEVLSQYSLENAVDSPPGPSHFKHQTTSLEASPVVGPVQIPDSSIHFPTIILSHVPFFRAPETDCGPLRERGRALSISKGYQYQNVLTPLISKEIIDRLNAAEVAQIYSGDDHDYCEIEHLEFTGRIKEITVKSMSWAMGVRRPGFVAVSLHNPVDIDSIQEPTNMPQDTIQNHLCLLPDQLGTFLRYAQLLGLTLVVLSIRALFFKPQPSSPHSPFSSSSTPLLPISKAKSELANPYYPDHDPKNQPDYHASSTSTSNEAQFQSQHLSTRNAGLVAYAQNRPVSPSKQLGGYGNLPASSRSSSPAKHLHNSAPQSYDPFLPASRGRGVSENWATGPNTHRKHVSKWVVKWREFRRSLLHVGIPALLWFAWLIWE